MNTHGCCDDYEMQSIFPDFIPMYNLSFFFCVNCLLCSHMCFIVLSVDKLRQPLRKEKKAS